MTSCQSEEMQGDANCKHNHRHLSPPPPSLHSLVVQTPELLHALKSHDFLQLLIPVLCLVLLGGVVEPEHPGWSMWFK